MNQQNLGILSDEWIVPSLVESEYPQLILIEDSIALEDPIALEDSIAPEDPIALVDSIAPVGSIDPQKIDFDSLTGIANNPTGTGTYIYPGSAFLKNAWLNLDRLRSGEVKVTVTIDVILNSNPNLDSWTNSPSFTNLTLKSTVWGIDGELTYGLDFGNQNDHLFNFPDQGISRGGKHYFIQTVPSNVLNEDHSWFDNKDEIRASISLVNSAGTIPSNTVFWTNTVTGKF